MLNGNNEFNGNGKNRKLLAAIIAAIITGLIIGGFFPEWAVNFSILGRVFLNLLMMIVVPLVIFSIITGITNLGDIRKVGTIGKRTVIYYFATTAISVLIGIVLVNLIQPGIGISPGEDHPELKYKLSEDNKKVEFTNGKITRTGYNENYILILEDQNLKGVISYISHKVIRVEFWESISQDDIGYIEGKDGEPIPVGMENGAIKIKKIKPVLKGKGIKIAIPIAQKISGKRKKDVNSTLKEVFVGDTKSGREGMIPRNIFNAMQRMDILPLIFFSLIFGAALSVLGPKGEKAIEFISICNDAILKIVDWIMLIAPIGIFGIVSARIGQAGGFEGFFPELVAVGKYSFTVIAGLMIHAFIVLPIILYFVGKNRPLKFASGVGAALLNAFSTASSSATLPLTMESIEKCNGISKRTAGFVLPIGATINMDGTALYEAVAAIFISQVYGIHLGMMEQSIIFITATLAAIGAAGIPEAGLVTMVIVLKAVGLPIEGIGLILTIDWFLDRCRTTVNVWGDSVGAGVIERLEGR